MSDHDHEREGGGLAVLIVAVVLLVLLLVGGGGAWIFIRQVARAQDFAHEQAEIAVIEAQEAAAEIQADQERAAEKLGANETLPPAPLESPKPTQ